MLLENNAEVFIPLLLTTIPSAKQFREAISSLSPEQQVMREHARQLRTLTRRHHAQRFASQIRAMQLESSLFGVLLVQIKPQMERLLRLPVGALTKEVRAGDCDVITYVARRFV
jgi:hypothetical protein